MLEKIPIPTKRGLISGEWRLILEALAKFANRTVELRAGQGNGRVIQSSENMVIELPASASLPLEEVYISINGKSTLVKIPMVIPDNE